MKAQRCWAFQGKKARKREREREKVTPMLNIETCTARGVLAQRDPEWIIHKHFNY